MPLQVFTDIFTDVTAYTDKGRATKERDFSHWGKVANVIYKVKSEAEILRILQFELQTRAREMVVMRVYSRFSRLREIRERGDILGFLAGAEDTVKDDGMWACWATVAVLADKTDLQGLKVLMQHEASTRKRAYIVKRLYGRYAVKRRQQEKEELKQWLKRYGSS